MTSLYRSLRLWKRVPPFHHRFQRSSFSSRPSNYHHQQQQQHGFSDQDYALPLISPNDGDHHNLALNSLQAIPTDNPIFMAASSHTHTPMDEIPWWDFSVYITDVVHMIHDTSGFSYATSIAAVTVVGRLVLVPIAIWHLRNNPWEAHMLEIKRLYDRANDPRAKARYKAEIESIQRQFPKRNRVALPVASLGTTLFMWIGLRRMSDLYPAEMTTGGVGWFMDLTQPDPYLFLPILSNFLMFSAHEVGADETGRPRQDFNNRLVKYSFAVIKAGLFCMWFFLPSSILCFWIPHSAISLVQTVVFSQPAVIQKLGFGHGGGGGGRTTSSVLKSTEQVRFYNQAEENVTINQDKNPHRTSPSYIRIKNKNKKASRR